MYINAHTTYTYLHDIHHSYSPTASHTKQRNSEDICTKWEETHPWRSPHSMSCTAWDGLDQYAQNDEASRSRNWLLEQFPFYKNFHFTDYFHSLYGLFPFYPEWKDRMERVYGAKKMDGFLQHTVMRCYWWCLFYVPPRRPNLHSPPVTPGKCMEQQPTQLPPTECAETSSSSQTHKQNSKHSGMTFELLVCMWALVSCMCSGTKE